MEVGTDTDGKVLRHCSIMAQNQLPCLKARLQLNVYPGRNFEQRQNSQDEIPNNVLLQSGLEPARLHSVGRFGEVHKQDVPLQYH